MLMIRIIPKSTRLVIKIMDWISLCMQWKMSNKKICWSKLTKKDAELHSKTVESPCFRTKLQSLKTKWFVNPHRFPWARNRFSKISGRTLQSWFYRRQNRETTLRGSTQARPVQIWWKRKVNSYRLWACSVTWRLRMESSSTQRTKCCRIGKKWRLTLIGKTRPRKRPFWELRLLMWTNITGAAKWGLACLRWKSIGNLYAIELLRPWWVYRKIARKLYLPIFIVLRRLITSMKTKTR